MTIRNYKIMDYKILAINLLFYKHSNNINKSTHAHTRRRTRTTHNADTSNCNYMCKNVT